MNYTLSYNLRLDNIQLDGSASIIIRFVANRKKADIAIKKKLKPIKNATREEILKHKSKERVQFYHWNQDTERVTKGDKNHEEINYHLNKEIIKGKDIIRKYQDRNKILTVEQFKKEFLKQGDNDLRAYEYFLLELEKRKSYYAPETMRTYKGMLSKFNEFAPNISIHDIDYKLLVKYENYMLADVEDGGKGNDEKTVANNFKVIRTFVNFAIKNNDILEERDPFKDYTFKMSKGGKKRRSFLEPEEVIKLEELYLNYIPLDKPINRVSVEEWQERSDKGLLTPAEYDVIKYFLYGCYTGLRYRDIAKHTYSEIKSKLVENGKSKKQERKYYIDVDLHKTGANIIIPLINKTLMLLDLKQKEGSVFNPISNQKANKHLKSIMEKAGIKKKISFHCSRHTFATLALHYGIPTKIVQSVLGHTNSRTTEVYSHLIDKFVFNEMDKIDFEFGKMSGRKNTQTKEKSMLEKLASMDSAKLDKLIKLAEII